MSEAGGQEDEDSAAAAFEALRAEVARLRQGIELLYRQGQEATAGSGVDYSLTLGRTERLLQFVDARLAAIEGKPALAMTPEVYRERIEEMGRFAGQIAGRAMSEGAAAQSQATAELKEVIGRARTAQEQRRWLLTIGVLGVMAGLVLWMVLVVALPGGAGTWLASLPLAGGNRWQAGAQIMQAADPTDFSKMVQLSQACGDQSAALCAAAIAIGTAQQAGQSGSEPRP